VSTLPILPACPEPATIRIELYSEDSLDACAYTCVDHTIRATAAVARAGLEAHLMGVAPDVVRSCGYVFVFPTGTLAEAPTAVTHPRWCDRSAGGAPRGQRGRTTSPLDAADADLALPPGPPAGPGDGRAHDRGHDEGR
jgi:hypothetical protein